MLTGRETWESVYRWGQETFPATDGNDGVKAQARKLVAEVVELALACGMTYMDISWEALKAASKSRGLLSAEVPGEIADVAIVLANLAGRAGVDVSREVDLKMRRNRDRTWNVTADGMAQHASEPVV